MKASDSDSNPTYPSFSYNDWTRYCGFRFFFSIFRLRDTLSAIKAAQQTISDNTEHLNEFITEDEDRRIFVSLRFSFLVLRCEFLGLSYTKQTNSFKIIRGKN